MLLALLIILAFIVGILMGIPTAGYLSPQSPTTIIFLLSPTLFLYFFSGNPVVNDIRYMYFSWVIGLLGYWSYAEKSNNKNGS